MAKKKATSKKKVVAKKKAPVKKAPPVPEVLDRGSFTLKGRGGRTNQVQWTWDGVDLAMKSSAPPPAITLRLDFGPEVSRVKFSSGGAASPDPDGAFNFRLLEPDLHCGWRFTPEGEAPKPVYVGLGK